MQDFKTIFQAQKSFFKKGETRSYSFRKKALKSLLSSIKSNETELVKALFLDLHKPETESYLSEIGIIYADIKHQLEYLREWMQVESSSSPLALFPSRSSVYSEPQGNVLILAPWNYPFQLLIAPLVAAVAAGNCAILKSPDETPNVTKVIRKIIEESFDARHVVLVDVEGVKVIEKLIDPLEFNHIFFTGSVPVGKIIMKAAAEKLTKVTLELGGKSPCIVDSTANIKVAAKRIAWSKAFNAGQTCVAPDYLLVHEDMKDKLIKEMIKYFDSILGNKPALSDNYGHIINSKRFDSLMLLLKDQNIVYGGNSDKENLYIQPTLVDQVSLDSGLMKEEIFGPILPIITWKDSSEIYSIVERNPYPLALYVYTTNSKFEKEIVHNIPFGGGCVNSSITHFGDPDLPFGGFQTSGLGSYHGKAGFDVFSHKKSIMKTANWLDVPLKYAPYTKSKLSWVKKFLK